MVYIAGWTEDDVEGWSAAACKVQKSARKSEGDIVDPVYESVSPLFDDFLQAATALNRAGHDPDYTFGSGLLVTHAVGWALFDSVGRRMPHQTVVYPEQVKEIAATANWTLTSNIYTDSHRACAKVFLEVCAKLNLGLDLNIIHS